MIKQKIKFKSILFLTIFFLNRLICLTETNINSYSEYKYKLSYIQEDFAQFLGIVLLIATIAAFFWLTMPIKHNNKLNKKK